MFESGNWRTGSDDEESEDEGNDDDGVLNLEKLRKETEAIQAKKEEERLAKQFGIPFSNGGGTEDLAAQAEETSENGESSGAAEANGATESTATT